MNRDITTIPTGSMAQPDIEATADVAAKPIGAEQVKKFTEILQKYKAGRGLTEQRIVASERWWKLRNSIREDKDGKVDAKWESNSGWLHNVITSKHADAIEAYPEPNVLPREEGDRGEAQMLSSIIPCILEQNNFEGTYSDAEWQKLKTGTGVYKITWDPSKLNGLGDISIERVNLLNVYWEPAVSDVQKSRYVFHTELYDKDIIEEQYPETKDKLKGNSFVSTKFLYDENADTSNKVTVIDVYYHKYIGTRKVLHYCKYVNDIVLFSTENDAKYAERGLYDHGKFPYVFDALFPIEGSPCGYGFVDLCRNPQTAIDVLKTCFLKNARVGAVPRYMRANGDGVNEEEFLDLEKAIVHVGGDISENSLRPIDYKSLDGNYISLLTQTVDELRQTSGNTEAATGSGASGATAASAIAALQEASGKGSRDATKASYRAFSSIVDLCIELIRQFYDMPRKFRIIGEYGAERFITYTNGGLKPQSQGVDFGKDMGYRLPVFDIKVSAQKKNAYTKVAQNELALQFFQLGFFNPQMTDQALLCLELMDFDGKDTVIQKVAKQGSIFDKLANYMQLALGLAQAARPDMVQSIASDMMMTLSEAGVASAMRGGALPISSEAAGKKEHPIVENARAKSAAASQPGGGRVI